MKSHVSRHGSSPSMAAIDDSVADSLPAVYQLFNQSLPNFLDEFSDSEVRSLEAIIDYNEQHSDVCMPPGTYFMVP